LHKISESKKMLVSYNLLPLFFITNNTQMY